MKLFYFKHLLGSQNSQPSWLALEVTLDSDVVAALDSDVVTDDSEVVTDDSLVVTEDSEVEASSLIHLYPIGL